MDTALLGIVPNSPENREDYFMNIGLLGFGVVGRGVYEITQNRQDMQVTKILCLEEIHLPDAEAVKDIRAIVEDDSIDTVVEAMGGLHPAYEFVRAAMEAGKNVVTSNKALVCTFYDELLPLVKEKGISFRCTAAVGGGIGWLSELERARRVQKIVEVGGIMNGTCNYILDNMTRTGLSYDEALKQAQSLGYAEANPSTDVDGIDTWHKVILSSNIAFGVTVDKASVPVAGIRNITAADVDSFKAHGLVCKLISTGKRVGEGYSVYVQPTLVKAGELEAAVPMNYNLITFLGETSERMSFYGQGAGRYPTAYNVVEDLVDVLAGKGFYAPYGGAVSADNSGTVRYYVRGGWDGAVDESWGEGVVTAPVAVSEMHAWLKENPEAFIAAIKE